MFTQATNYWKYSRSPLTSQTTAVVVITEWSSPLYGPAAPQCWQTNATSQT